MAFDAVIITLAGAIVAALFQRYAPDAYMVRNAGPSFPCMSRTALACTRHAACLMISSLKVSLCILLILWSSSGLQDEWFHVPQTQRYCRGDFQHWDPKITTFPGLYLLAAPYARAVAYLQSYVAPEGAEQEACGTGRLRSINVLLAAAFFVLMQQLHRRLHPQTGSETATLMVCCTPHMPCHRLPPYFEGYAHYRCPALGSLSITACMTCSRTSVYIRHPILGFPPPGNSSCDPLVAEESVLCAGCGGSAAANAFPVCLPILHRRGRCDLHLGIISGGCTLPPNEPANFKKVW